jgi:hypothetical protein
VCDGQFRNGENAALHHFGEQLVGEQRIGWHALGVRAFLARSTQAGEHREFRLAQHYLEIDLAALARTGSSGRQVASSKLMQAGDRSTGFGGRRGTG